MIQIRKSNERGHANYGWLDTFHSFSFGGYYDPEHMNWRYLRVLNEDRIGPDGGFPAHPHDNMEIFSYVTEGILEHKDSLGSKAQVRPGRAQLMSAGTGIQHSEYNPSGTDTTHLFQVWIMPSKRNTEPSYQELDFDTATKNTFLLLAHPEGDNGSMRIEQNVRIYSAKLDPGVKLILPQADEGWLQVLSGSVALNGNNLSAGDAAGTESEDNLSLESLEPSEVLWFAMD